MAATNKCLAESNKSRNVGKATKKREPAQGFKEREIVSQPQWQQRTNVWPKVTSPGTTKKREPGNQSFREREIVYQVRTQRSCHLGPDLRAGAGRSPALG